MNEYTQQIYVVCWIARALKTQDMIYIYIYIYTHVYLLCTIKSFISGLVEQSCIEKVHEVMFM